MPINLSISIVVYSYPSRDLIKTIEQLSNSIEIANARPMLQKPTMDKITKENAKIVM